MTPLVYINREDNLNAPKDGSFDYWISTALNLVLENTDLNLSDSPEISLRINGLEEMTALNTDYRQKQGPTNVLSFPANVPDNIKSSLLGDIVICAPLVEREAKEQQKTLHSHWAHMTIHSLLHLLGFDHIKDNEAEAMESMESNIMERFGFPNPYQVSATEITAATSKLPLAKRVPTL